MSQFLILILMLVQLLLVLLCVVATLAFINYRRRHEEDVGAQMLIYHITSHKDLRVDALTALIEKIYGSQGEELKNIVDQLYMKEADCYRELIQVFMTRDPKQLPKIYEAVQKITSAYEGMLLQFSSDSKDQITVPKKVDHFEKEMPVSSQTANFSAPIASPTPSAESISTQTVEEPKLNTVATDKKSDGPDAQMYSPSAKEVKDESSAAHTNPTAEDKTASAIKSEIPTLESTVVKPPLPEGPKDAKPEVPLKAEGEAAIESVLPSDQEMAYYQDKLMTYLESKEVSKDSVTGLLDKDNQK